MKKSTTIGTTVLGTIQNTSNMITHRIRINVC